MVAERKGVKHASLYSQLGWVYFRLGKLEEAETMLRKAVSIEPRLSKAHFCLGVVLESQRKVEEAADSFQRALAIEPRDYDSLVMLAKCHLDQNESQSQRNFANRLSPSTLSARSHGLT